METIKGKIASLIWQAENTLYLIIKMESPMEFSVGKFVKMKYKGVERAYTCCNLGTSDVLELFIKMKEGGEMSNKLKEASVGESLEIKGQFNEATFDGDKILCIGGGSGMAAFMSLIRSVERGNNKEVVLFVSSRRLIETGFLGELKRLKKVRAIVTLTREDAEGHEKGHIDRKMIEKHCNPGDYSIFICGPKEFTRAIGDELKEFKPKLLMW